MNTITQIYDEHASMPPHGETKKNQKIWLIIYCTTVNISMLCYTRAKLFYKNSLINSSSHRILIFVYKLS